MFAFNGWTVLLTVGFIHGKQSMTLCPTAMAVTIPHPHLTPELICGYCTCMLLYTTSTNSNFKILKGET